jgi:fumarate reductase flavoprotein subunit
LIVPDTLAPAGAIVVNQIGRRFVNENAAPLDLAQAILAQPGKVAYLIFDERIYRETREIDPYFARLIVPKAVRRDTNPADLARHFEIDADDFLPTLSDFHTNIVRGTDPFGRSEGGPPFVPPFFGIRIAAARVRTLGGLRINDTAEVIRADRTPVTNLYASGGVVADVASAGAPAYSLSNHALTSLVWGWVAGRAARPPESD